MKKVYSEEEKKKIIEMYFAGKTITEISNEAFIHCSIMNFYCYAVTPPSFYIYNGATIPFYDIDEEAKLYVPEKCGTVYNNAFGWSIFKYY